MTTLDTERLAVEERACDAPAPLVVVLIGGSCSGNMRLSVADLLLYSQSPADRLTTTLSCSGHQCKKRGETWRGTAGVLSTCSSPREASPNYDRYPPPPVIQTTMTKNPFESALNPITDNRGFTLSCGSTHSGLLEGCSVFC